MEVQADQASFRSYLTFFAGQQVSLLGSSVSQFGGDLVDNAGDAKCLVSGSCFARWVCADDLADSLRWRAGGSV